jgi:hypothetical protein
MIAAPSFAAFPAAPPRLAGMGLLALKGGWHADGMRSDRPAGVEWPVAAKRVVGRRLSVSGLVVFEAADDQQRSAAAPARGHVVDVGPHPVARVCARDAGHQQLVVGGVLVAD